MAKSRSSPLTEMRKSIERRSESRAQFYGHLAAFAVLVGGIWLVGRPAAESTGQTVLNLFTLLWGAGLAVHFVNFRVTEQREREIQAVIERFRRDGDITVPERLLRLTDDGEVDEVDDEDDAPKRKRR